jgi:hypothetical protein
LLDAVTDAWVGRGVAGTHWGKRAHLDMKRL